MEIPQLDTLAFHGIQSVTALPDPLRLAAMALIGALTAGLSLLFLPHTWHRTRWPRTVFVVAAAGALALELQKIVAAAQVVHREAMTAFSAPELLVFGAAIAVSLSLTRATRSGSRPIPAPSPWARGGRRVDAAEAGYAGLKVRPRKSGGIQEAYLYRTLRAMVMDDGTAERLIAYEHTRKAHTRKDAIQAAINRLHWESQH